jgi:hypothetical protein
MRAWGARGRTVFQSKAVKLLSPRLPEDAVKC